MVVGESSCDRTQINVPIYVSLSLPLPGFFFYSMVSCVGQHLKIDLTCFFFLFVTGRFLCEVGAFNFEQD